MDLSHANSIRYTIMNALTGEFLTQRGTWTPCVFDANLVMSREVAGKLRTEARKAYADDIDPVALDIVRVRADVRRGSLGRPRKVG